MAALPPSFAILSAPMVVIHQEGELMAFHSGISQPSVQKGDKVKAGQKIVTADGFGTNHSMVRKGLDAVSPESSL